MKRLLFVLSCLFLSIGVTMAQTKQVTGIVVDDTGEAIIGASVIVKGTNVGDATDVDGKFTLNVPADSKTLVVSYVGMDTKEVAITPNVRVILKSNTSLDELVVTAIGIERASRSLGYGMSIVDANEAMQKAEPDMLRSLDGKIPGVSINGASGSAGSATRVTIRGNSSFFGNNEPLYVVDGMPYSNESTSGQDQAGEAGGAYGTGISTLDPNDIESMSVLKGAAAASLYGSRAANGVILITTKSGSRNRKNAGKGTEVTINASYTIEEVTALPNYQNKFGGGNNFIPTSANGSWGAPFGGDIKEISLSDVFSSAGYGKYYPDLPDVVPYKAYKNNVKDLFETGGIYDISANISSYNDKGNFSATLSKMDQDSYIPHSDFSRYGISVGGNQKLTNGLTVGGKLSFSSSTQNGAMYGNNQSSGIGASSLARALILGRNWDMSLPYETPDGNSLFYVGDQADNPLWSWKYNTINTKMDRIVANFNAAYEFSKEFSATYTIGINDYKMKRQEILNLGSRALGGKGRIKDIDYNFQEIESNLILEYKTRIKQDYGIIAHLGQSVNQRTSNDNTITGKNIMSKGVKNVLNTESQIALAEKREQRLVGFFGDVTVDYKNYAFITLTGRNDLSSTLPKNKRSYFYPSVSGSLVFTDAFGLENDMLNFGKVRLSWAKVGNDADPYYKNGFYTIGRPYNGVPKLTLNDELFDDKLKPEFTTEIEFGAELQLVNRRVNIDFTYYNRNTTDQIAPLTLPYSSGYGSYWTNFGKINNKGVEIGLNLIPIATNDFKWDLYATYTKNKSEVKELTNGVDAVDMYTDFTEPKLRMVKGKPYGALYGSTIARDDEGNMLIDANSGFYLRNNEPTYLGDPAPKYKASLSNTFTYKGISLGVMFDLQVGGNIYTTYVSDLLGRGVTKDTENRYGGRIMPGVLADASTQQPILDANGNKIPNNIQMTESDLWFAATSSVTSFASNGVDEVMTYDATTLRLREISLGYDLPKKWLQNTFIGSANVSFVARNLWFHAPNVPKHSNYDPTMAGSYGGSNMQGIDYTSAPNTRRFAFNLRLTF
ncbi:SusC/RagA family TonB-linked outer membrane protein [Dysgonomonas sp. 520]|uniref:SusC/RagA family TonB-linked outer membrane protein n=1 Tax=Dysgonomonas sp. 520 TaxID=2302931 RepID=UPI0013D1E9EB|nr:SusC/RagA family TonB-linked outer membrane protein [Dysgonomonas sp. 520]NDW10101.1 SusC/RagA family TonB-linked outer membrane protein [Dysgonomonas sp. 520]